jgi:hypothetical protein
MTLQTCAAAGMEAEQLWHHLFAGVGGGYLALFTGSRPAPVTDGRNERSGLIKPVTQYYRYPDQLKAALTWATSQAAEGREVYFCAHLLTDKRRIKKNAAPIAALWVDLDGAAVPTDPAPSCVVESSPGRYHAYLRLTRPIDPVQAEQLNRRLAHAAGGDPSGHDLTQLLRVPATCNFKYADTPLVRLRDLRTDLAYEPDDLDRSLPTLASSTSAERGVPPTAVRSDRIPQGRRNTTLTSLAGTCRRQGLGEEAITTVLETINNQCCDPPLDADEIASIARSVGRYPPAAPLPASAQAHTAVTIVSAGELLQKEFPPPRWLVDHLIPDGASLLVGSPKTGKSWLALGLAVAVATGSRALGAGTTVGDVLYLALEDGERRLQYRLRLLLGTATPPPGLHCATAWPRLDEGGLDQLDAWLARHPNAQLVVVDTLKRIRPHERPGRGVYGQDYDALGPLADLAHRYKVSILVVHHASKRREADDPVDLASGSTGLTGAVDHVLVLRRQRGTDTATLFITGRDVEQERELALEFNRASVRWEVRGDAAEFVVKTKREQIRDYLATVSDASAGEVADALGWDRANARQMIHQMHRAGEITRTVCGRYATLVNAVRYANSHNNANIAVAEDDDLGFPRAWPAGPPANVRNVSDGSIVRLAHARAERTRTVAETAQATATVGEA